MAGRGVDIKLGEGVVELGGLYVVGTERHEARRIDNQLRGRSGRQGDPGESRFYLSGEDQLVRLFAGDRIKNIMARFKVPDDQPMEAKVLSRQIENAQKKVEEQNFVMRKNVLKYDDVMNKQRTVIYEQRRQVLEGADLSGEVKAWVDEITEDTVDLFATDDGIGWDLDQLCQAMTALYGSDVSADELREDYGNRLDRDALVDDFREDAQEAYAEKETTFGINPDSEQPLLRDLERFVILQVVDVRWREHLESMDYMREGVHLRSMAQKDPLVEYTAEGHKMFEELSKTIRQDVVGTLFHAELAPEEAAELNVNGQEPGGNGSVNYEHQSLAGADAMAAATAGELAAATAPRPQQRHVSEHQKVGRNDPCWCGSGKKFKKCHGA
jgi:preprotein translocase subunit SecA